MGSTNNIVLNALPKSGSKYIATALAKTLGCPSARIASRGFNFSQVDAEGLHEFIKAPHSVAQQHFPATAYNLKILEAGGLARLILLVRDPRDALVSWAHHLERDVVVGSPWHEWLLIASGIIPENYYRLSWNEKLDALIRSFYPFQQDWIREWLAVAAGDLRFSLHVATYESFLHNRDDFIDAVLRFYRLPLSSRDVLWPSVRSLPAEIDHETHFRRGVAGSHADELSPEQKRELRRQTDEDLFRHFQWPLEVAAKAIAIRPTASTPAPRRSKAPRLRPPLARRSLAAAFLLIALLAGPVVVDQLDGPDVRWKPVQAIAFSSGGSTSIGSTVSSVFHVSAVPAGRVAQIRVRISAPEIASVPDALSATVTGPDGLSHSADSGEGKVEIVVPVSSPAPPTEPPDGDADAVAGDAGQGEWTVAVGIVGPPEDTLPPPGQASDASRAHDFRIEFIVETWQAATDDSG